MTPIQKTARVGGKDILLETGKVTKQAHGAVWVRLGDSIVLVTVVSAAENGPGTADVTQTFFDPFGNVQWVKDPDGYIHYAAYDLATGAQTTQIIDGNNFGQANTGCGCSGAV